MNAIDLSVRCSQATCEKHGELFLLAILIIGWFAFYDMVLFLPLQSDVEIYSTGLR
jgi:hypothetical protein